MAHSFPTGHSCPLLPKCALLLQKKTWLGSAPCTFGPAVSDTCPRLFFSSKYLLGDISWPDANSGRRYLCLVGSKGMGEQLAYNQEVDKTGGYPMPECPEPYAWTWTRAPALFPTHVVDYAVCFLGITSGYQRNRSRDE